MPLNELTYNIMQVTIVEDKKIMYMHILHFNFAFSQLIPLTIYILNLLFVYEVIMSYSAVNSYTKVCVDFLAIVWSASV